MSGNVNARGRRPRNAIVEVSNWKLAQAAWGTEPPRWVTLLATACDAANQKLVGERLGKSSGYVSRLINNKYPGDMAEAERLVRAAYGDEGVVCPLWGTIPLANCMRNRRRKGPPRNQAQRLYRMHCPSCPNNSDAGDAGEED
jgi:hypothetical protein